MREDWLKDLQNSDPKIRSRAIVGMAESHDAEALKALKYLFEKDADPQVRLLANKAGAYLWKTLNAEQSQAPVKDQAASQQPETSAAHAQPQKIPQSSENNQTSPAQETVKTLRADVAQETPAAEPAVPNQEQAEASPTAQLSAAIDVNSKKLETARIHLNRALALVVKGNNNDAMRALQQACYLNPKLINDQVAMNLAGELTGLPAEEAIKSLQQQIAKKTSASANTSNSASRSRTGLFILIGVLLVIVVVIVLALQFG